MSNLKFSTLNTWHGHRVGDRVRVTFEADIAAITWPGVKFGFPGTTESARLGCDFPVVNVERVEKPLAVGDRVYAPLRPGSSVMHAGELRYVEDDVALVRLENGGFCLIDLPHLERAS